MHVCIILARRHAFGRQQLNEDDYQTPDYSSYGYNSRYVISFSHKTTKLFSQIGASDEDDEDDEDYDDEDESDEESDEESEDAADSSHKY